MESIIKKLGKASITVEKDYHSSEKEYNKLTIVEEQGAFKTYLSRKPVPVGIELTNREYWIPFSGILESITLDYLKFKKDYASGKAIEDNAIITRHILDRNIERIKIALKAISEEEIDDNAIIERTIKDRNVTSNKIAKENILTEHLAKKSIITNILADYAITAIKLADNSITTRSIVNENVTQEKLSIDLQSLISNLSKTATFAGIATPTTNPEIPTAKTFYIATDKGIYNNFNGIEVTEDEIVILYFDTTWHKKTTGIAPKETLIKLKEKVDSLALGTFYGFFPDSSFLPIDITTSGYAYVGLDTPYKIWNFNGESWSDSGTSIDMNDTDEEDITRNIDGKLQFKNKEYGDGMGYVILRKNKSFAEQVIKENTIYEIRYDFDLNNQKVIIPDNCILKFNGGSISNGIIESNNIEIKAYLVKIFDNIVFTGKTKDNNIFEVPWFVANESISLDSRLDAYLELQSMFNSGIINIHFSGTRYYYISKTITINHVVNITGPTYNQRRYGNSRAVTAPISPCIYTDKLITLIQYNHPTNNNPYANTPINIGGFDLLNVYDYSVNYSKSEIPFLLISAETNEIGYSPLWGINIDVNITNHIRYIEGVGYIPNMVGIKFLTNGSGSYITYVKMYGYIQGVISGYDSEEKNGGWITSVEDNTDKNWIVQVCRCKASPLFINGQNQNGYERFKELFPEVAFVEGGAITLNGSLWDVPVDKVAVKCDYFTNNCPNFMGQTILSGNNGYNNPYLPDSKAEIPYQGKTNNILEGLLDNVSTPLFNKFIRDYTVSRYNNYSPIKDYDIELYNSADLSQSMSVKGTINEEYNIFNPSYLGKINYSKGKYSNAGYNNVFTKYYGDNTSIRYSFTFSPIFVLDASAYLLTHVGDFSKLRVKIQYRNSDNNLIEESVIKEINAKDYYRNVFYTHIGQVIGSREANNLLSGFSKLIVEYENNTGITVYPPIGVFNSTYKGLSTSGGNIVGRVNIQDVVHTTPSAGGNMNIYYDYNKYYGRNKTLSTSYVRVLRVKYESSNKLYFSFRTKIYWNYVEVNNKVSTCYIADKDITVKVDIYTKDAFNYLEVYIKSKSSCEVDFGKLFSKYGVEFIDDNSTELDSLTLSTSKEFVSNYNLKADYVAGNKIIKIKTEGNIICTLKHGNIQSPALSYISLGTGTGSNSGKPTNLVIENLVITNSNQGLSNPIAYKEGSYIIIEVTSSYLNYIDPYIEVYLGSVLSIECIKETYYNDAIHTDKISGTVLKKYNIGTSEERPSVSNIDFGYMYFDTTLQKPIWWTGSKWVDATGVTI